MKDGLWPRQFQLTRFGQPLPGTERIMAELLVWWRDPPLLDHYGIETALDDGSPSTDLALAWLRDERRLADPIPLHRERQRVKA